MRKTWIAFWQLLFVSMALGAVSAQASTVTYTVAGMATAVITTDTNTVTITLTDLVVNPSADTDNISAFKFTLSDTPTSASIASSSAQQLTLNAPAYTLGSTISPGWALSLVGAQTTLDVLTGTGHAGPAQTIIGAPGTGGYTNANGSLKSNSHNPYLYETATWTLTEMGVTANTTVTTTTFQFGTAEGQNLVTGMVMPTPEPSTFAMLSAAGVLIGFASMRRRSTVR